MSLKSSQQEEQNQKVEVEIKTIHPYILEIHSNNENKCLLCRNSLDDVCNECKMKNDNDTNKCSTVQGKCGHKFHLHCILKWTEKNQICPYPLCNSIWEYI